MNISKKKLMQIIKEELDATVAEQKEYGQVAKTAEYELVLKHIKQLYKHMKTLKQQMNAMQKGRVNENVLEEAFMPRPDDPGFKELLKCLTDSNNVACLKALEEGDIIAFTACMLKSPHCAKFARPY